MTKERFLKRNVLEVAESKGATISVSKSEGSLLDSFFLSEIGAR